MTPGLLGTNAQHAWQPWESLVPETLPGDSTDVDILLPNDRPSGYKWPIDFSSPTAPRANDKTGSYTMTNGRFRSENVDIDLRTIAGARAHPVKRHKPR